ncbi:Crp/Fnr family transcriptional regulator [Sediminicola luteus]|uniref:Cyclic nucleotide-binding domain-containing protein n=1 Tax=Sediminicola luteus TaxID=319238 RepID=A0A2A4G2W9_9FLAO|nr:Crp/Fnr family transcriptional regulator [Sediminicola luteus]PCE62771.1 hypothetical protein B7P33_15910 [Sediminicola luteus]
MALLDHIRNYVPLSEAEAHGILGYFSPMEIHKNHELLVPGAICHTHYFVEEGCLQLHYPSEKGHQQILQFALKGWWLTDYLAFRNAARSEYGIKAVVPSKVQLISKADQDRLLENFPAMETYFRQLFEIAYGAALHRMRFQHDMSKEARYLHFINSFPDFAQQVPQKAIASFLGLTPEYVSEIRKKIRS